MTSLFLPDMLQTDKNLCFLSPYGLSQWNLAFGDIFYCLLVTLLQKGKKRVMDQVMMMSSDSKQ